jgi:6-phosphogluconate dehydrogenase
MRIGVIGLDHMGGNISRRWMKAGHQCVVFDANAKPREELDKEGATAVGSLEAMVKALGEKPRVAWVPAGGVTEETVAHLAAMLAPDDIVIDGGNSSAARGNWPRSASATSIAAPPAASGACSAATA